jgi:haloalkane dehalogenase
MEVIRTPEERFKNLPDFPFEAKYLEVDGIRIHYIDEGPKNQAPILLMHGEPTWSFLYRHMISGLLKKGYRVMAPDLVGCGKSDKPKNKSDYTYALHVYWMTEWLKALDLKKIVMFCQDWGSLIGLRIAAENEDRFSGIILSNGGLPDGRQKFSKAFQAWKAFSKYSPIFEAGSIVSTGTVKKLSKEVVAAYNAPFPTNAYKAAIRIFPSLVPDQESSAGVEDNKAAWEVFKHWNKPFLTVWGKNDPITRGGEKYFIKVVPGAAHQKHQKLDEAGHFIQEDKPEALTEIIADFIEFNQLTMDK